MTSRFLVAAVTAIAASVGLVGVPAMAGDADRPSVSVRVGPAEKTLTVDVPAAATRAEVHVNCAPSGPTVTAVELGQVRAITVPAGCDDYSLLIEPVSESR
jgi:hypothetical protein